MKLKALASILIAAGSSTVLAAEPDAIARKLRPFLTAHCSDCHNADEKKGGLDLDSLAANFDDRENFARWVLVYDRVTRGEMPPKENPRPPEAESRAGMQVLESALRSSEEKHRKAEGRSLMRRLSRDEYQNTIRDLLRVDVDVRAMLPEDGLSQGFDKVDLALDVSAIHLEKYLEAADAAIDAAIVKTPRPRTKQQRYSYLDDLKGIMFAESVLKLPDAAAFTIEGWPQKTLNYFRAPVRGRYKFRISAYAYQTDHSMPIMIFAGSQKNTVGKTELTQAFDAPPGKPAVHEWVDLLDKNDTVRVVSQGFNNAWNGLAVDYRGPCLAVQWVEAEGPLIDEWPPASTTRLLGDCNIEKGTPADAIDVLRRFIPRAFRRSVDEARMQPYFDIVNAKFEEGVSFEDALRVGLKAVLVSPDFLYFQAAPGKLDDYALASRLSYFLWSSMPDDTLLDLAAAGQLTQPATLRAEVERMLADPKGQAFTENFTGQWLKLRDIKATMPDNQLYPEFEELLERSMVRETYAFFNEVLGNNLSLLNFVHSDFAMLNSRLAKHYGIPGVEGLPIRKVALKPEWHRGGVLTQAAVLKVTANGTNTSPVVRGAFVLDRILGRPAPPPPKNVPAVEPDIRGATTIRAQLEKHRNVESCAVCHDRIDPPGAALESYDVIGGWQKKYRALTGWNNRATDDTGKVLSYGFGPLCETDAALPDGRKFTDLEGFKQLLLGDEAGRDQVARALTEKLIMYATGHAIEFTDRAAIGQIVSTVRAENYGFRKLIHEIVQSETFQSK